MISENLRFHASGHLASAHALMVIGKPEAAIDLLKIVQQFARADQVEAPPQLKDLIAANIENPKVNEIKILEQWFCDPFNTVIESSRA